jgi:hypothetical protein
MILVQREGMACIDVQEDYLKNDTEGREVTGASIILGWCPSLLTYESESMLRTYVVCREKQQREREKTSKRHVGEAHSVLTTAILLPQRLSCY